MSSDPAPKPVVITTRSALLGLAEHRWNAQRSRWLLRPRWIPIGVTGTILLGLAYCTAAYLKYTENKYVRECPETSYREMLLFIFPDKIPFTKDKKWTPEFLNRRIESARISHRTKLGAALIVRAKKRIEAREYLNAFGDILTATQLDPQNREARVLAAQVFLLLKRDNDAMEALERGLLNMMDNREYIRDFIMGCLQKEQDERLIGVTKYHLAHSELQPEVRDSMQIGQAMALFNRGQYDACRSIIEQPRFLRNRDAFMLRVKILIELGDIRGAIAQLEDAIAKNPGDSELTIQAITLRDESGDRDGARTMASLNLIRANKIPSARIKYISLFDLQKDKPRIDQLINEFRADFAGQEKALLELAHHAAATGQSDLCAALRDDAERRNFTESPRFRLLCVESHLVAGRYEDTVREVDAIFTEDPEWLVRYRLNFDALRMVAHFALDRDDTGEIAFKRMSDSSQDLPPALMETIGRRLLFAHRPDIAVRVVDLCVERNKHTSASLASLLAVHFLAGGTPSTPGHLREFLTRRRPSRETLIQARKIIAGDSYLFDPLRDELLSKLDSLIAGRSILKDVPEKSPRRPGDPAELPHGPKDVDDL